MKGIILCVLYVILACIERQLSNLKKNYEVDSCVYFFVESFDEEDHYIYKTYKNQLKKKVISCQAVFNKLYITSLPKELGNMHQLERTFASRRILFKKMVIIPKERLLKMKGCICNVPIAKVYISCSFLP